MLSPSATHVESRALNTSWSHLRVSLSILTQCKYPHHLHFLQTHENAFLRFMSLRPSPLLCLWRPRHPLHLPLPELPQGYGIQLHYQQLLRSRSESCRPYHPGPIGLSTSCERMISQITLLHRSAPCTNALPLPLQSYTIVAGASILRTYRDNHTDSGATVERSFCGNCGSSVSTRNAEYFPDKIIIHAGTIDAIEDGKGWTPQIEAFCKRKSDWLTVEGTEEREAM